MPTLINIVCSDCGAIFPKEYDRYTCSSCEGSIRFNYNYSTVKFYSDVPSIWKYRDLLPINSDKYISLGEGKTRIVKSRKIGPALGLTNLYFKDETRNPTQSFKDRAMSVGVSKVLELGGTCVATASSGNAAISLAAYSAAANLKNYSFVSENIDPSKLARLNLYGSKIIKVREAEFGDSAAKLLSVSCKEFNWHPVPSFGAFNPYQREGVKTISYELNEDLKDIDYVFSGVGSGGLLAGVGLGFADLLALNKINKLPCLVGVQSAKFSPFVDAMERNIKPNELVPSKNEFTIADGLADPLPWDYDLAREFVNKSNGFVMRVTDEDILSAVEDLAKFESIASEPSGCAVVAALKRAIKLGLIEKTAKIVLVISGNGSNNSSVLANKFPIINPNLMELKKVL